MRLSSPDLLLGTGKTGSRCELLSLLLLCLFMLKARLETQQFYKGSQPKALLPMARHVWIREDGGRRMMRDSKTLHESSLRKQRVLCHVRCDLRLRVVPPPSLKHYKCVPTRAPLPAACARLRSGQISQPPRQPSRATRCPSLRPSPFHQMSASD